MQKFGVDALVFTPERPRARPGERCDEHRRHSRRRYRGDGQPTWSSPTSRRGTMELKAWSARTWASSWPPSWTLPVVRAALPYDAQVEAWTGRGHVFAREAAEGRSGVSQMDAKTQVTRPTACRCSTWRSTRWRPMSAWRCSRSLVARATRKLVGVAVGAGQPARRCRRCSGAGRARSRHAPTRCWRRRWPSSGRGAPSRTRHRARPDRALRGGRTERRARREFRAA